MKDACVIFGAGELFPPKEKLKDCLIIAADGGYSATQRLGLEPQIVIGDFDSGDEPSGIAAHIIKLKREKDDTDTLAAIKVGLRRGKRTFIIYGGTGGRLDHTIANISSLRALNNFDARGFLVGADFVATVITNEKFSLPNKCRGIVSVFAYGGEAHGVKISGLQYTLDDKTLSPDFPLGVSNHTVGNEKGTVSVKDGSLLIFFPRANQNDDSDLW